MTLQNVKISLKTDDLSNWTSFNPVLNDGELAIVNDISANLTKFKVGNGLSTFTQLPYVDDKIVTNYLQANDVQAHHFSQGVHAESSPLGLAAGYFLSAAANFSQVMGVNAQAAAGTDYSFVWNGNDIEALGQYYSAHGKGSFNINPLSGISGVYVGEQTLADIIDSSVSSKQDALDDAQMSAVNSGITSGKVQKYDRYEAAIQQKIELSDIPSDLSAFTNSPGYLTAHQSLSGYYTKSETSSNTQLATAFAEKLDPSEVNINYNSTAKKIILSSRTNVTSVDCVDFIKDGMLSSAELCGTTLVLKFNTDAGSSPISIEMSSFVDNYDDKMTYLSGEIGQRRKLDDLSVYENQNYWIESSTNQKYIAISNNTWYNSESELSLIFSNGEWTWLNDQINVGQTSGTINDVHLVINDGEIDISFDRYSGIAPMEGEHLVKTSDLCAYQLSGNYLTSVPADYKTYDATVSSLSNDGYALASQIPTKVSQLSNDASYLTAHQSLSGYYTKSQTSSASEIYAAISSTHESISSLSTTIDNKIFIDGLSAQELSITHISQDDFYQRVQASSLASNEIYVVSSDYINAYGQQMKNLAEPTDLSDAATKGYVDNALSNVQIPTDLSSFTNSTGYLVSNDISGYYKKSETSSASQISSALVEIASLSGIQQIVWADLVDLAQTSALVPGMKYRITDYVATVANQSDARSAAADGLSVGFDIIVTADSTSKLNEKASAIRHAGNTYYPNTTKFEAWQVLYCLDNDTTRFAWADTTNGKGVVYRLIDEFNNDVPYDFKGIQFKAYGDTDNVWRWTFDNGAVSNNLDTSKNGSSFNNNISKYKLASGYKNYVLNRNIFKGSCYCNRLDYNCHDNTFGDNCNYNILGSGCYNNISDSDSGNIFGIECHDNILGYQTYSNVLNDRCNNISIGDECCQNTFQENCSDIEIGTMCINNMFNYECSNIVFGNECNGMVFGNNCNNIKFGSSSSVTLATAKSYCRYINIASGNQYIVLNITGTTSDSSYYQNVDIKPGVNNTTSYKTITDSNVNQNFCTTYQPANSQVIAV